jgi:hypothetical protein
MKLSCSSWKSSKVSPKTRENYKCAPKISKWERIAKIFGDVVEGLLGFVMADSKYFSSFYKLR